MARFRLGRPSLRTTLLTLLVGLLLVTVFSLAAVVQLGVSRIVDEMESRSFTVGALAVGTQVDAFFAPTLPLLQESVEQVQRNRLRLHERPVDAATYALTPADLDDQALAQTRARSS